MLPVSGTASMRRWLIGLVLGGLVGALAHWRRALSADGAVAAAIVGCVVWARGGPRAAAALLAFFVSSSALSRVGQRRKRAVPLAQAKGARRDAFQVLANGGVATLCLAFGQRAGFVGALAAASADTWATELGMLANGPPRLITSLRRVPAGTSGGVTPEGLLASAGGALVVGLAWAAFDGRVDSIRTALVAGVAGSLGDSLVGATVQASYWCPRCCLFAEEPLHRSCGGATELRGGLAWITNDTVNVLATLLGAGVGALAGAPNAAGHERGGS